MAVLRPPGPRDGFFGIPTIGRIKRDVLGFYRDMQRQYGDVVYMRLGPYHDYSFFRPDAIREVLVTKAKHFVRMPAPLQVLRQWNGDSVLIVEGDEWLRQRRVLQPAFALKRFSRYAEEVTHSADELFRSWGDRPLETDIEVLLTELTTTVICRTMFGSDVGVDREQIHRAVQTLSHTALAEMFATVVWPDWLPTQAKRDKKWAMSLLRETVDRIIASRRTAGEDTGDLLSMLLLANDEEGDRRGLTDVQARDNIVTIFLAGHDTTASALTWIAWCLAKYADQAARAAAEVDAAIGGRTPTFADLPQLAGVERFVKETLRLFPPAIAVFARQATDKVTIAGWEVPCGGIVRITSYVVHNDERWFPEAGRFDPDRFAPGRSEQIPNGAYLPFGMGPRTCMGNQFALMEMTLVTAMLLQRFRIEPAAGQAEPKLQLAMSLRPAGGMRLKLTPRSSL